MIAKWGAGSLLALMTTREQVISLDAGISNRILLFSLALAAITSTVRPVIPAFRATRVDLRLRPQERNRTSRTMGSGPVSGRTIVVRTGCRIGAAARQRDAVHAQPVRRALDERRRRSPGARADRRRRGRGIRGRPGRHLLPAIAGARAACQALRPRARRSIRRSAAATAHGRRTSASMAGTDAASVGISTPSRPTISARPG